MKTEALLSDPQLTERSLLDSEQRYERLLASVTDHVYTITIKHGQPSGTSHGPGCERVSGCGKTL